MDILTRSRVPAKKGMVTGANKLNVTEFADMQYLCIMVDPTDEDGMRIPETVAYTAMGDYVTDRRRGV